MRARILRTAAALALVLAVLCGLTIHAAALDNTYRFEDLEMSIKFPKSYSVITRDTKRTDPVFQDPDYDYSSFMTAFNAAKDIYLFAYDPDKTFRISLAVTEDEQSRALNNYADLSMAERQPKLEYYQNTAGVSSVVEVKRGDNIFIDSERVETVDGKTVYIALCNTVINGMSIDLTLYKNDKAITAEETKTLSNAASSLTFDHIDRNTGAVFEWWRLLLWAAILAGFAIAITVIYKQYNAANKRKLEERLSSRKTADEPQPAHAKSEEMTFEESLGYQDDEEFAARAEADEMASYDIKIREQNSDKGIEFFEDGGSGINDGSDYFDTYFREPVERRTRTQKLMSAIGSYLRIAFTHTGYFFKNLYTRLVKLIRKK